MKYYLKENTDGTVSVVSQNGIPKWSFCDMDTAMEACIDWYCAQEQYNDYDDSILYTAC